MNPAYPAIARRAEYRCEYCHAPEIDFNFSFEIDHIVPQAAGGTDDSENLALACHGGNLFKSDFESGPGAAGASEVPLFNPRREVWDNHFRVDPRTGELVGTSDTGRTTVVRLRMNRPHHVVARRRWIQMGLM